HVASDQCGTARGLTIFYSGGFTISRYSTELIELTRQRVGAEVYYRANATMRIRYLDHVRGELARQQGIGGAQAERVASNAAKATVLLQTGAGEVVVDANGNLRPASMTALERISEHRENGGSMSKVTP